MSCSSFGTAGWDTDDSSEARGHCAAKEDSSRCHVGLDGCVIACDEMPHSSKRVVASNPEVLVSVCVADGHGGCHIMSAGLLLLMNNKPARRRTSDSEHSSRFISGSENNPGAQSPGG